MTKMYEHSAWKKMSTLEQLAAIEKHQNLVAGRLAMIPVIEDDPNDQSIDSFPVFLINVDCIVRVDTPHNSTVLLSGEAWAWSMGSSDVNRWAKVHYRYGNEIKTAWAELAEFGTVLVTPSDLG